MIDLSAELRAAGLSADAIAAIFETVVERGVRKVLDERERDTRLDSNRAGGHHDLSSAAFKMRLRHDPSLDSLAVGDGRFRRWRRVDLDAWPRDKRIGGRP